jgi:hypothetical protein
VALHAIEHKTQQSTGRSQVQASMSCDESAVLVQLVWFSCFGSATAKSANALRGTPETSEATFG